VPHDWRIAEREYERHEARRGRRHAFETLDPATSALVVVDMVTFFAEESEQVRSVVPNINALAGAVRSTGGTVAWVTPAVTEPTASSIAFYGADVAAAYGASGAGGLWPELDRRDGDVVAEKSAASAFFPGRSPLPDALTAAGVDTVLVTGTVTSVCVESTARDASTLGYRVVLVADACADMSDDAHNAALRTVYRSFGDVRPTADVRALLSRP
jgi:nicotinamidase-related amidase